MGFGVGLQLGDCGALGLQGGIDGRQRLGQCSGKGRLELFGVHLVALRIVAGNRLYRGGWCHSRPKISNRAAYPAGFSGNFDFLAFQLDAVARLAQTIANLDVAPIGDAEYRPTGVEVSHPRHIAPTRNARGVEPSAALLSAIVGEVGHVDRRRAIDHHPHALLGRGGAWLVEQNGVMVEAHVPGDPLIWRSRRCWLLDQHQASARVDWLFRAEQLASLGVVAQGGQQAATRLGPLGVANVHDLFGVHPMTVAADVAVPGAAVEIMDRLGRKGGQPFALSVGRVTNRR
ncbi:hypothetical protein D3C80_892500 [compost metagenome]